jgi:hypothetical protein
VFRERGGFDCVRHMETDLPYGQNVEVFIVTTSTVTCVPYNTYINIRVIINELLEA